MIAVEHPVVFERGLPSASRLSTRVAVVFSHLDAATRSYRLPIDNCQQLVGIRGREVAASELGGESRAERDQNDGKGYREIVTAVWSSERPSHFTFHFESALGFASAKPSTRYGVFPLHTSNRREAPHLFLLDGKSE